MHSGPERGFGGEGEGGGVRSGPGAARTILLVNIISARPSKQPLVVRTFLKVYGAWLLCFVSARTNKRHRYQCEHQSSIRFLFNLYTLVAMPEHGSRFLQCAHTLCFKVFHALA